MVDVKLTIRRTETKSFANTPENLAERTALHVERAKLVHGLVDTLELEVNDWGLTDDPYPHEVVEIIVALGSAGVFTAAVSVMKAWLDSDKLEDVAITLSDGTKLSVGRTSQRQLVAVARELGLAPPSTSKRRRTPDGTSSSCGLSNETA